MVAAALTSVSLMNGSAMQPVSQQHPGTDLHIADVGLCNEAQVLVFQEAVAQHARDVKPEQAMPHCVAALLQTGPLSRTARAQGTRLKG